jgi:L-fuconolactonase
MTAQTNDRRLDSHHHFWTLSRIERDDYHWMAGGGPLREDYAPERLAPELERAGVGGTIVVQAAQSVDETRFLLDLAGDTGFVLGVTGWVPLDRPEAIGTLGELAHNEYLRAVRPMIHDLPDPNWIARPEVRQNLQRLAELGLRFEVLTYAEHLPSVHDVLAEIPELPAVVDHLSKPAYQWDDDAQWRTWMSRLAERPNTYCKLSGMVTEVGPGWTVAHFEPYAGFVFETFGTDRVMFGSDWPVCRLAGAQYRDVVELADRLISPLARDDADAFWRRNAERFYGVRLAERRMPS